MKRVICDIETDSLDPNFVWVIVTTDVDNPTDVMVFKRPDLDPDPFLSYAKGVDTWIGHNFISFDYMRVLRKFLPEAVKDPRKIIDTLVVSRLLRFDVEGGHSLDTWASRLGMTKPKIDDFTAGLSEEMIHRCVSDVEINLRLFKFFETHIYHKVFEEAIRTEHDIALICEDMKFNGFGFNAEEATRMITEIDQNLMILDREIANSFPPKITEEIFVPKVNSTKYGYQKGIPFIRRFEDPFNPASPKQIVERLNEAGWKPINKTKGHITAERNLKNCRDKKGSKARLDLEGKLQAFQELGWSVDEENLSTLPSEAPPGARKLAERITLASRKSSLVEWMKAYDEKTGSIHGSFMGIGSWTQRMAHQAPNQANIPGHPDVKDKKNPTPVEAIKIAYNMPMRALWVARPGRRLIGVDADGIQLRILAHLMDDRDFTKALVEGNKDDHTDAHSLNAIRLGIGVERRPVAKTFIYAWLLGAGDGKVAEILGCTTKEAKDAVQMFLEATPGLKHLKEKIIPEIAAKGYFVGVDGRYVPVPNEHKVLAGLLQNGETVIMKKANILWRTELRTNRVPFWQVNFVHDEWQTEAPDDDAICAIVEKAQIDAIKRAGEIYNLKCPLLGTGGSMGYNWAQTH